VAHSVSIHLPSGDPSWPSTVTGPAGCLKGPVEGRQAYARVTSADRNGTHGSALHGPNRGAWRHACRGAPGDLVHMYYTVSELSSMTVLKSKTRI
jgi:hypothetical protein